MANIEDITNGLRLLEQAAYASDHHGLGRDIERLRREHEGTLEEMDDQVADQAVTLAEAIVEEVASYPLIEAVAPAAVTNGVKDDLEEDAPYGDLADEVDEAMLDQVLPHHIDLFLSGVDGYVPTAQELAETVNTAVANLTWTLAVEGGLTAGEITTDDDRWTVRVSGDDLDARTKLATFGAGKDGINMRLPYGSGDIVVTSLVGNPDDPDAAADLGVGAVDLPEVGEGEHEINGAVALASQAYGVAIVPARVVLTYTRLDGGVLSEQMARDIVFAPISQSPGGLPRFGMLNFDDVRVAESASPSTKTVSIDVIAAGEVNPATIAAAVTQASGVATVYGGQYPFPGMGIIECGSEVELVNEPAAQDGHFYQ